MLSAKKVFALSLGIALLTGVSVNQASASKKLLIAATKTEKYKEKEGFERKPKDIINTLKDNEVTRFTTLLDGLEQAFDLDDKLKDKGPFTLLAVCDHGFKRMPGDDVKTLFANKKKLRQVLEYHVIEGKLDSKALKEKGKIKTLEGHEVTISERGNSIYADDVLVQTIDLPCSNGMIHILDGVIMPQLSK